MTGIVGVVLAGGLARRMGGGDKGLIELQGRVILDHVLERLAPQVDRIIINANGEPARLASHGLPIVPDSVEGFAGPLAGVLAGMEWAVRECPDASWIVTAATDTPFFPRDLVARFHQAVADQDADMACAASGGRHHPVFGLWPVGLGPDLRRAMTVDGIRKVDVWTARHRLAVAGFADQPYDPFFNVNRPDDVAEAERIAQATETNMASHGGPDRHRGEPAVTRKVIGIAGYKKSGKTTLVERLVREFTARGLAVATVKHAHHAFDIDHKGRDSWRHRAAGAREVAIVSDRMWAIVHPLHDEPEPALDDVLAKMAPSDLVIVEGYKRESYPKIEVRGEATNHPDLAPDDPTVIAIAASGDLAPGTIPVFSRDDVREIADFIAARLEIAQP